MKQKITLISSMMLIVSAVVFGQTPSNNYPKNFTNKHFDLLKEKLPNFIPENNQTYRKAKIKQQLDSTIEENWNIVTNKWANDDKTAYTYNANQNLITEIRSSWSNENSVWENYEKTAYTYDENENLASQITYAWNNLTRIWDTLEMYEFTYDSNGKITELLSSYSDSIFKNQVKYEFTYDANGNITAISFSSLDSATNTWEIYGKFQFTYDVDGKLTELIGSDLNSTTNEWENYDKTAYSYNANGNLVTEIYSEWNSDISVWEEYDKTEYTYDKNNNLTDEIYSNWNSATSTWESEEKYEYTYDLSYSMNEINFPSDYWATFIPVFNSLIVNKPINYTYFNYINGEWEKYKKGTYHYSNVKVTSVTDVSQINYDVYPNPTSDILNFSFAKDIHQAIFELYDIQGRKLMSKEITNNEQLSLKELNKGIYLYKLYFDGDEHSGKLIKD